MKIIVNDLLHPNLSPRNPPKIEPTKPIRGLKPKIMLAVPGSIPLPIDKYVVMKVEILELAAVLTEIKINSEIKVNESILLNGVEMLRTASLSTLCFKLNFNSRAEIATINIGINQNAKTNFQPSQCKIKPRVIGPNETPKVPHAPCSPRPLPL